MIKLIPKHQTGKPIIRIKEANGDIVDVPIQSYSYPSGTSLGYILPEATVYPSELQQRQRSAGQTYQNMQNLDQSFVNGMYTLVNGAKYLNPATASIGSLIQGAMGDPNYKFSSPYTAASIALAATPYRAATPVVRSVAQTLPRQMSLSIPKFLTTLTGTIGLGRLLTEDKYSDDEDDYEDNYSQNNNQGNGGNRGNKPDPWWKRNWRKVLGGTALGTSLLFPQIPVRIGKGVVNNWKDALDDIEDSNDSLNIPIQNNPDTLYIRFYDDEYNNQ